MELKEFNAQCKLLSQEMYLNLKNGIAADGGFVGGRGYDNPSSLWTTAEILYLLKTNKFYRDKQDWLRQPKEFLIKSQNQNDGGWGFRPEGKSITDITAWAVLALLEFEEYDAVARGVNFLINARYNEKWEEKGGWGLTTMEPDHLASTWIATKALAEVIDNHKVPLSEIDRAQIQEGIEESLKWIKNSVKYNAWGASEGETPNCTNTAHALLTISNHTGELSNYLDSKKFLQSRMHMNLWFMEKEIIVTREQYDLHQEWFTTYYCTLALIEFSRIDKPDWDSLMSIYDALFQFIKSNESFSKPNPWIPINSGWPLAFILDLIAKLQGLITNRQEEFIAFLAAKNELERKIKIEKLERLILDKYPQPISITFKKFRSAPKAKKLAHFIELYEVILRFYTVFGIMTTVHGLRNKNLKALAESIKGDMANATNGTWQHWLKLVVKQGKTNWDDHIFRKMINVTEIPIQNIFDESENFFDSRIPPKNMLQEFAVLLELRNE
jgi:hypothetical protein